MIFKNRDKSTSYKKWISTIRLFIGISLSINSFVVLLGFRTAYGIGSILGFSGSMLLKLWPYYLMILYKKKKDWKNAYKWGRIASKISKPKDILFLNEDIYNFVAKLDFSVCAYHTKKYLECLEINLVILKENKINEENKKIAINNCLFSLNKLKGKI